MFPRSNVMISGGHFWHNEFRVETAFEKLQKASASSALHDSSARFDPPKCHPNTRVAILEYLMRWIFGHNDPEALVLWLYGPAGAGKSAILQTIAERCFERKALLASFFFARSDSTRNTFKPLVATIAYQIATTIPELKQHLESVIERDPLIFDKSIATQVQLLIIEPVKKLPSGFFDDLSTCARLVLIDGLDECEDPEMQSLILRAIATSLHDHKLPLIFLIASRPEQRITLTFNSPFLAGLWRSLVLDASFKPDKDIRLFLTDSFQNIKTVHPYRNVIPEVWPKQSDIDKLVEKSSGQFIYAAVVVKYVSGHDDRPHHRLEVVKGLRPARRELPFAELDALYTHILESCKDSDAVLLILGPVLLIPRGDHVATLELLFGLEPTDVEIALTPVRSLVDIRKKGIMDIIALYHASFSDFLFDNSRSAQFYIDKLIIKADIYSVCLLKLAHPSSITNSYKLPTATILSILQSSLSAALNRRNSLPLTKAVEKALKEFSLPKFWISWSHSTDVGRTMNASERRAMTVAGFLNSLEARTKPGPASAVTDPERIDFLKIYNFHLSSFQPIVISVIAKYYQDVGLTSLIVLRILGLNPNMGRGQHDSGVSSTGQAKVCEESFKLLFRITEDSMKFDAHSFQLAQIWQANNLLLVSHYRYLFSGTNNSPEVCLDGTKYIQTALRILEFICGDPPYHIRQRHRSVKYQVPNALFGCGSARKLREKKHRRGATLSPPETEFNIPTCTLKVTPGGYGLDLLPKILENCPESSELVAFIRTHGKKIAFLPRSTRKAIRAMHEYLDRAKGSEDVDMVDLQRRFAAMVIE